ncbi:MAG: asparaginase domain-containing protein [Kocuria sp.]|nr:asparaginase domain-containing protein [Kocuria sp.]
MSETNTIKVLTTGGTVDKIYSLAGELEIGDPAAPDILGIVRPTFSFTVDSVLRKDSLDLTDDDRQLLCDHLNQVTEKRVVITHGTDTMTVTADYLQAHARNLTDRVVVFTGAMQPASLKVTDSHFNLGAAFAAVQLLDPGIYIAMSGRIFPVGSVIKDRAQGQFVAVTTDSEHS